MFAGIKKFILDNIRFDTFTFKNKKKRVSVTEITDAVRLFFTSNTSTTFISSDINVFYFSFFKIIPIETKA